MKELIIKWKEFTDFQEEARNKVRDRMDLWVKENPMPPMGYLDALNVMREHDRSLFREKKELDEKFGVMEVTMENFLTSLINK